MMKAGDDVMLQIMLFALVGSFLAGPATAQSILAASIAAPLAKTTEFPFDLVWDAPPECPHGDAIKSDVLRLAGGTADYSRRIRVRVAVRQDAVTGWTLALATELDGDTGERVLSGQSCRSVSDAAALTLALVLNPDISRELPSSLPPRAQAEQAPSFVHAWLMGAGGGLQTGLLKETTPAFALSLGIASGRASLRLIPSYTPEQSISMEGRANLGARLRAGMAALLGCWTLADGRGFLAPCLGYDVIVLHGRGVGVLQPREQTVSWTSAEIGLMTGLHLNRRVSLEVSGLGLLSLNRPGLYLDDVGVVTRPALLGFRGFAAIELAFR